MCVMWMWITVVISFLYEAFGGIYRADHKAHLGVLLASSLPWLNLLAMYISLKYSTRFDFIALAILFSNIIFFFIYAGLSIKILPTLSFSFQLIQPTDFKYLFRKGFAFQAFPVGNALTIQGSIIIVQLILGPAAVALYGTAKTLVNTIKQVIDIISQSTWPELSHLIGSNDLKQAAAIHRMGVALAIVLSTLGFITIAIFGGAIYSFWVGKSILLPFHLLIIFLLPIPLYAFWITSSVVHLASNKHEGLAIRYIIAAFISTAACFLLTKILGIEGAAISGAIMDIVLIPYVVRYSLIITDDTWKGFLNGCLNTVTHVPSQFYSILSQKAK